MVHLGEIAHKVARRYCDREHEGATPCDDCTVYRAVALAAIGMFVGKLSREVQEHLFHMAGGRDEPEH